MFFNPVQVTSTEISPQMSVHQGSEQQLQVQVSIYWYYLYITYTCIFVLINEGLGCWVYKIHRNSLSTRKQIPVVFKSIFARF